MSGSIDRRILFSPFTIVPWPKIVMVPLVIRSTVVFNPGYRVHFPRPLVMNIARPFRNTPEINAIDSAPVWFRLTVFILLLFIAHGICPVVEFENS